MEILSLKVVVMGLGYIGLPTASMLATKGHKVIGVDISNEVVQTINSGNIHIVEPGLDMLVKLAIGSGNLIASLTPDYADVFIMAVPTPFKQIGVNPKSPDISYIEAATCAIAPFLQKGNLVILESTSPVGTTEKVGTIISRLRPDLVMHEKEELQLLFHLAYCPERVLPGQIIQELTNNDRIVGGICKKSAELARNFYKTFCSAEILITDARTAEMTKLVENSYRDVNIAFANELSIICDGLNIDVWELIGLANRHPRVNILAPGSGVGGHCIAVDPWFIVNESPDKTHLIRTAREVNDSKPHWVVDKVESQAKNFKNPIIGCLGLAFKANIDDLRESPAMQITKELMRKKIGQVMACEPNINITNFDEFDIYELSEVLQKADLLVVLVDHDEFKAVDKSLLQEKVIIDCRGIWSQY
jgi:UDP-N-acetyl-D-mannosaminuronic acid dehydrogenase